MKNKEKGKTALSARNPYQPERLETREAYINLNSTHWSSSEPEKKRKEKKMRASIKRPPTPDADEEQDRQPNLQEVINMKLIESGEKERLKELLRERLIECGWRDEMKSLCRAFTRKKGRNNVTLDDLVHVITPKGRASVPDSVKAELLQRIRSFLASAVP
ncbi:unnamed protein product [Ilex paraguariensis]|uniref:Transcription and mRNA export factor ENY2 n=1 Tax=Ilex paraguariensis TaxID=185542 RepID=A0ABC8QXM8_9AQUA